MVFFQTNSATTAAEADGSVSEVFLAPSSVSALNDSVVEVVVDSGNRPPLEPRDNILSLVVSFLVCVRWNEIIQCQASSPFDVLMSF